MALAKNSRKKVAFDFILLLASGAPLIYFIVDFERLINLWGSTYLSQTDVLLGSLFVIVCIEASRRQSAVLGALSLSTIFLYTTTGLLCALHWNILCLLLALNCTKNLMIAIYAGVCSLICKFLSTIVTDNYDQKVITNKSVAFK